MAVGFYFDMTRCTGCRACQIACKDKNRLDAGVNFREARSYTIGDFPRVRGYSYSASCNHCEHPACLAACPEGAIYQAADGTVIIDQEQCAGRGDCFAACPYGVPKPTEHGTANKCDGCYAIRQAGGNPACVDACPSRALDFGDLDELRARYGTDGIELVRDVAVLPSSEITSPSLLIRAKEAALDEDYRELSW